MDERHKLLLVKQNPQWAGGVIDAPVSKRRLFSVLKKFLGYKQVVAVVGLRRVGKTVLLKQLMKELDADSRNVCYVSFDDRDFQKYETAAELIEYFLKTLAKEV